ncbi:MAG: hypothetical protein N2110_10345, partial [Flavobacteriales bacterium]|nr:hypothetical protein [Flavobacteriales bacterium]
MQISEAFERLWSFLAYAPERPWNFIHPHFWVFYTLVLALDALFRPGRWARSLYLWVVSIFFYFKTSGLFFFLLLFTIHIDYFLGHVVYCSRAPWLRRSLVAISVTMNLGILAYFKYAYFFTESFNQLLNTHFKVVNHLALFANTLAGVDYFQVDKIILPVGISFYTFQTISYTVDIYRGRLAPARSLADFGFFVAFFPQLVAGPIMRASEFLPQIYQPRPVHKEDFGRGLFWMLNGLVKKVFVADYLAVHFVDRVFANPGMFTGFENLMATFCYSLQVYCDFSGYTDIAYGVALLMGFELNRNFNSPYKAATVGDFWRRWHMSLSTFLRDYVYIPLGGNRKAGVGSVVMLGVISLFTALLAVPLVRQWQYVDYPGPGDYLILTVVAFLTAFGPVALFMYAMGYWWQRAARFIHTEINLMITMLVGGLWHGASWMFVIWGGLNGVGLMAYKLFSGFRRVNISEMPAWRRTLGITITFVFISFTRIFFRSADLDTARSMIDQILQHFGGNFVPERIALNGRCFLLFTAGMVIHWLPDFLKEKLRSGLARSPLAVQAAIACLVVLIIYQASSAELTP